MEINHAWDIAQTYGKYMEDSKVVHMGFDDNLPYSKIEILDAIWTLITEEDFSRFPDQKVIKDSLYMALFVLFQHLPRQEEYSSLIEYQQNWLNSADK